MELHELRPDTDAFRSGPSHHSGRSGAALHTKAMAFDHKAVFIGSFNLDPRSAVINTEASRTRVEVEAADEHGFTVEGHGLGMQAAADRPDMRDQPDRKASVSGRSSYSSMPFSSNRLRVLT